LQQIYLTRHFMNASRGLALIGDYFMVALSLFDSQFYLKHNPDVAAA